MAGLWSVTARSIRAPIRPSSSNCSSDSGSTSIALALLACVALAVFGSTPWLALAVLLIWLGTLWLTVDQPPPVEDTPPQAGFTRDTMAELIEHSGTPLLLTERNRVTIANRGGRVRSAPSHSAVTLARPGWLSRMTGSRPSSLRNSATYSAAARSPGPGSSP